MGYRMKNHDRFILLVRMIERNSVSENGKRLPEKREVGRDDKNRRVRDKRSPTGSGSTGNFSYKA